MKTLFLYYSFTGNGDVVADYLSGKGAEIRKVEPKKPLPKSFFWSVMTGGFLATVGHKSKLLPWDTSFEGFDRIVIGSPVWNARFSCPINSVLAEADFAGKELAFVLYSGSGAAPKAAERIAKEYPTAQVITLKDPKKYPDELSKLDELL